MTAIIFFGHGARDIRWREPFDRLLDLWHKAYPKTRAELAFLELMTPSLKYCIGNLNNQGIREIKIIPVFFGQGGHLRNDFPVLLDECAQLFPEMRLSSSSAVGESDQVLQAIIGFAMEASL